MRWSKCYACINAHCTLNFKPLKSSPINKLENTLRSTQSKLLHLFDWIELIESGCECKSEFICVQFVAWTYLLLPKSQHWRWLFSTNTFRIKLRKWANPFLSYFFFLKKESSISSALLSASIELEKIVSSDVFRYAICCSHDWHCDECSNFSIINSLSWFWIPNYFIALNRFITQKVYPLL